METLAAEETTKSQNNGRNIHATYKSSHNKLAMEKTVAINYVILLTFWNIFLVSNAAESFLSHREKKFLDAVNSQKVFFLSHPDCQSQINAIASIMNLMVPAAWKTNANKKAHGSY